MNLIISKKVRFFFGLMFDLGYKDKFNFWSVLIEHGVLIDLIKEILFFYFKVKKMWLFCICFVFKRIKVNVC